MCKICGIGVLVFNGIYIGMRIKISVGGRRQMLDISMENLSAELNADEIEFLCRNCKKIEIKRTKKGSYITDIELYRNVRVSEITESKKVRKICTQIRQDMFGRVEGAYTRC